MASASLTADERQADAATTPVAEKPRYDPRTRALIEGPIAATLVRLAAPNMLVMLAQTSVGLIETYFVGKLGTDALAGVALVFPVVMLMQMMSAGAMGGGISSAVARTLGAGRRADADALALHALVIAVIFGLAFTITLLAGGRALYALMGGSRDSLAAAMTYSTVVFAGAILVWLFNSLANIIRGRNKATYTPHVDTGDYVVVINAEKIVLTGKKDEKKEYMAFSGFVGGERYKSLRLMREKRPEFVIMHAVKGMLPKNRLAARMLTKLRVFAGTKHPHEANNPVKISV